MVSPNRSSCKGANGRRIPYREPIIWILLKFQNLQATYKFLNFNKIPQIGATRPIRENLVLLPRWLTGLFVCAAAGQRLFSSDFCPGAPIGALPLNTSLNSRFY